MSYLRPKNDGRRIAVIAFVLLLHGSLLFVLLQSSPIDGVARIRAPFETRILDDARPPLPSEPERTQRGSPAARPPSRPMTTPKAYVPAAEVPVSLDSAAAFGSISHVPLAEVAVAAKGGTSAGMPAGSGKVEASVRLEGCIKPEYPPASIQAAEEGVVELGFLVDVNGNAIESRVDRSSGYRRLDEAARRALARCRFQPASVDGIPRQSWARIKYEWRLE